MQQTCTASMLSLHLHRLYSSQSGKIPGGKNHGRVRKKYTPCNEKEIIRSGDTLPRATADLLTTHPIFFARKTRDVMRRKEPHEHNGRYPERSVETDRLWSEEGIHRWRHRHRRNPSPGQEQEDTLRESPVGQVNPDPKGGMQNNAYLFRTKNRACSEKR